MDAKSLSEHLINNEPVFSFLTILTYIWLNVHSFPPPFIPLIFTEHLVCIRSKGEQEIQNL